jgi:hypothetical protein
MIGAAAPPLQNKRPKIIATTLSESLDRSPPRKQGWNRSLIVKDPCLRGGLQSSIFVTQSRGYANFVFPGIATSTAGTLSFHAYSLGPSRSWLWKHLSQVSACPVYVHIRPMIASIVLLAM